jgi:biopolymer transport protein ExbB/TolQ
MDLTDILGYLERAVLIVLVGLSIWSVAIIIECRKRLKSIKEASSFREIEEWLDSARAVHPEAIGKFPPQSLGVQLLQSLLKVEAATNAELLSKASRSLLLKKKLEAERGLSVLATLGANAPFIGLFGTVLGIIRAFAALGGSGVGDTGAVMAGISVALVATAAGLFVAIPAVVAFNVFSRQIKEWVSGYESLSELAISRIGR